MSDLFWLNKVQMARLESCFPKSHRKPRSSRRTGASTSVEQRVSIARADQAIFSWVSVLSLGDSSPLDIALPYEPGDYEMRLLDVTEQDVLARRMIRVD